MEMLDESWHLGTKFARFELSYSITTFPSNDNHLEYVLQFDITHAEILAGSNQAGAALTDPKQGLVQLRLGHGLGGQGEGEGLKIQKVELVGREQRSQPPKMPCGKDALGIHRMIFRATEWDYYGHQGSWARMWHVMVWNLEGALVDAPPVFVVMGVFSIILFVSRWVGRWRRGVGGRSGDAETGVEEGEGLLEKVEEGGGGGFAGRGGGGRGNACLRRLRCLCWTRWRYGLVRCCHLLETLRSLHISIIRFTPPSNCKTDVLGAIVKEKRGEFCQR